MKDSDRDFWIKDVVYTSGGVGLTDKEAKRRIGIAIENYIDRMLESRGITWDEYVDEIREKVRRKHGPHK